MATKRAIPGRHKMTPKRRAQLKRAQAISARKRRMAPNKRMPTTRGRRPVAITTAKVTKRGISKKHIAIGIGAAGVIAGGLYAGRRHQNISRYKRERALIRKHRRGYIPPEVTVYHHTYRQGHRRIQAEQRFKHAGRFHSKQDPNKVWFTTGHKEGVHMDLYGDYVVKVRLKRKDIADFHPGWGSGGRGGRRQKGNPLVGWAAVDRNSLAGKKIESHFAPRANPVHGTKSQRARVARVKSARRLLSGARFAVSGKGIASLLR